MTNREFFATVIAMENVTDEMKEFAEAAIRKLDNANSNRRDAAAKKRAEAETEKAPIREALMAVMGVGEDAKTATQLIEEAGLDIKPQAVPSLLKGLVEEGTVLKVDVKVKGKGTQRGYVKAAE